jgi:hypothetical protein
MATYRVVPAVDRMGFHVAIQGSDGIRQTILGFDTSVELDFGRLSSIAGDVYQAVECDVGKFVNIVYLTRRFKTAPGP